MDQTNDLPIDLDWISSLTTSLQQNLEIPDYEKPITIEEEFFQEGINRCKLSLVGKFLTNHPLNWKVAKQSIISSWKSSAAIQSDPYPKLLSTSILWHIWLAQNELTLNHEKADPITIICKASNSTSNNPTTFWIDHPPTHHPSTVGPALWSPPPPGWMKLNCDGATNEANNTASATVVARDSRGIKIATAIKIIHGSNADISEAVTFLTGVVLAKDKS
ncbi:hypothetical protein HHK36_009889 [Tetracentron sinense]|uniref:RNase H type-1 domain-containing protein n=1 Tax=Tetracentron sinense TaxID=13715 RepID=A0A834ZBM9_TETSI|nr:hypothetical protein HHK36_009889 [Tetracentron sinense]